MDHGRIYVADLHNERIRIILGSSVRTLAGTGVSGSLDGPALSAQFNQPADLAVDRSGIVYVADSHGNRIRMILQ